MGNIGTFIRKAKAASLATAIAITGIIGTSMPTTVNASTAESSISNEALQYAEADFDGFLDRANDGAGQSGAKTAKDVFEFCYKSADISGEDWKFGVTVGDYYLDFMSGEVTTGGYATGAVIDVFKDNENLFSVSREGSVINYGYGNCLDLDGIQCATTPFILTGSVSWGVETVCSADMAMACALYECIMAEVEAEADEPEQIDEYAGVDGFFEYVVNGNIDGDFENYRNEACNGVANGWKQLSDAKSMFVNANGSASWGSGLWRIQVYGQDLTSVGLAPGYVTATDLVSGGLLRFSFSEEGEILVDEKVGGCYASSYRSRKIESPSRYEVIDLDLSGKKIDTELLALAAVVDHYCASAPRG